MSGSTLFLFLLLISSVFCEMDQSAADDVPKENSVIFYGCDFHTISRLNKSMQLVELQSANAFYELKDLKQIVINKKYTENHEEILKNMFADQQEFLNTRLSQKNVCATISQDDLKDELKDFIKKTFQETLSEQKKLRDSENMERYLSSKFGICNSQNGLPENCAEALKGVDTCTDGVYLLHVRNSGIEPFYARCVRDKIARESPAWTIIQLRTSGFTNFYRGWDNYKMGFGDLNTNSWLGLEKIHAMTTSRSYELRIDMEDWSGEKRYALYDKFVVGSESEKYRLSVLGSCKSDIGDSLLSHVGERFTTFDSDNDDRKNGNCAEAFKGGWWYADCHVSNPNGVYNSTKYGEGIVWKSFHDYKYSLKSFSMAIRPSSY